jgi:hypothetical protein
VIALRAVGKVTADDYRTVLEPEVERVTRAGGKVRLYLELGPEFDGYDFGGLMADAHLGVSDARSFERLALVTDSALIRDAVGLFAGLMPGAVKVFSVDQSDAARSWISA